MEDQIDYKAGVVVHCKVGDAVKKDQSIATIYSDRVKAIEDVGRSLTEAFTIASSAVTKPSLIIDVIRNKV